jgi:hypothetical protein
MSSPIGLVLAHHSSWPLRDLSVPRGQALNLVTIAPPLRIDARFGGAGQTLVALRARGGPHGRTALAARRRCDVRDYWP